MAALRLSAALALTLLFAAGCGGTSTPPVEPPPASPPVTTTTPPPPPPKQAGTYKPGDCLAFADQEYVPVNCTAEHQIEVAMSDKVPDGFPAGYPPSSDAVAPTCRAEMRAYLGGTDVEATRIEYRVLWPSQAEWNRGERWFGCAMLERGPENKAAVRTTSLAGALKQGLGSLRRCYAGEPLDEPPRVVPCDQAHRSEAVEGVVPLGSHTEPAPSYEVMMHRSLAHCLLAGEAYLGGKRPGVGVKTVMPATEFWASGATNAVCYVIGESPVSGLIGAR